MTASYEKEQKELLKLVADGKKKLMDAEQTKVDLRPLMKALRDDTDIRQLTPEIVNALIRRIEVHSKDKETKKGQGRYLLHRRWAVLYSCGKRDTASKGGNLPKPAAVQAFCINQNTVQPLFRDCTVSYKNFGISPQLFMYHFFIVLLNGECRQASDEFSRNALLTAPNVLL